MAEMLDRAAQALDAIAREIRASQARVSEEDGFAETSFVQREIAQRIRRFWEGVRMNPVIAVGEEYVDLRTAQGRWELVVLAVLMGARARHEVIAETFHALRERDLIRLEVLAGGEVRDGVHQVFQTQYRALCDRRSKADALVENARYLVHTWNGELNNVYAASLERDVDLVRELQRFIQIDRMALWICRTMKVCGIWPDVRDADCCYIDRSVRLPLERLPMKYEGLEEERARRALALIDQLFAGDVLPLHLQGSLLCAQDDVETCLSECPVASWCRFPKEAGGRAKQFDTP